MRVEHVSGSEGAEGGDGRRVLASTVEVADTALSQARGLMFRRSIPEDYALVLEVGGSGGRLLGSTRGDAPPRRVVHMLGVGFPIDVVWLRGETVVATKRMRPWRSVGAARADRILELPAGAAADVAVGDAVVLADEGEPAR